jgi:hypothetical protein
LCQQIEVRNCPAVEAVLVPSRRGFGLGRVGRHGMSEGDTHSPFTAENAVAEVRRTRDLRSEGPPGTCGARDPQPQGGGSPHRKGREDRARVIRSCRRNVNCAFTRVVRWGLGSVVRDALRASVSLTSGIERSSGARVENRLQKSVKTHLPRQRAGGVERLSSYGARVV